MGGTFFSGKALLLRFYWSIKLINRVHDLDNAGCIAFYSYIVGRTIQSQFQLKGQRTVLFTPIICARKMPKANR